jgi:hypothetical protein
MKITVFSNLAAYLKFIAQMIDVEAVGPDLNGYIVVREDGEDIGEARNARRALNSAEIQEEELVDVRRLVLGCSCCEKRGNCLLYTHTLDVSSSIVKE